MGDSPLIGKFSDKTDEEIRYLSRIETTLYYHSPSSSPVVGHQEVVVDSQRPANLIRKYLCKKDLLKLRQASTSLAKWVGTDVADYQKLFHLLYITDTHRSAPKDGSLEALRDISRYCEHMYIRITTGSRAPSQLFLEESSIPEGRIVEADTSARRLSGAVTRPNPPVFLGRTRSNTLDSITSTVPSCIPSPQSSGTPEKHRSTHKSDWLVIFEELINVTTITISIDPSHVHKGWGKFSNVEAALISIRIALEKTNLRKFHTLRLKPIHAYGVMHCVWDPMSKYEEHETADLWQRVQTLELQLINPLPFMDQRGGKHRRTSESEISDWYSFIKQLHDWLASFQKRLGTLKFHWIGEAGPNPLALNLTIPSNDSPPPATTWRLLRTILLGNVTMEAEALYVIKEQIPLAITVKSLPVQQCYQNLRTLADFKRTEDLIDWSQALRDYRSGDRSLALRHLPALDGGRPIHTDPFDLHRLGNELADMEADDHSVSAVSSFDGMIPGIQRGQDWFKGR